MYVRAFLAEGSVNQKDRQGSKQQIRSRVPAASSFLQGLGVTRTHLHPSHTDPLTPKPLSTPHLNAAWLKCGMHRRFLCSAATAIFTTAVFWLSRHQIREWYCVLHIQSCVEGRGKDLSLGDKSSRCLDEYQPASADVGASAGPVKVVRTVRGRTHGVVGWSRDRG